MDLLLFLPIFLSFLRSYYTLTTILLLFLFKKEEERDSNRAKTY